MKKKILIYTMIMSKGGTENTIANLANEWITNYEVTIVSNIKYSCEYDLNKKIKYLSVDTINKKNEALLSKIITKFSKKRSKVLKKIIEIEKPDIIFTFLPEPTIRILSLKKHFPNIPIVVCVRNHPKKEYYYPFLTPLRNFYYKKASKIIIQDEVYLKYFPKYIQNKILVIPNYISDEFTKEENKIQKVKRIVTVSRLEKQKNIPLLIDAFSKLNHKFKDYKLYVYGSGSMNKKIRKMIKKLNLENRIYLIEGIPSVKLELEKAMIFVLSSNYEGMPNTVLEAMAIGLPVIVTNSTEVMGKIIHNYENGIIVPKNNQVELTKNMELLLDNIELRESIGKKAKIVKKVYNKENVLHLWNSLVKGSLSSSVDETKTNDNLYYK